MAEQQSALENMEELGGDHMRDTWETFCEFYRGKRVLVTGHTGFKGAWLCRTLTNLGAQVTGYAKEPPTCPSLF